MKKKIHKNGFSLIEVLVAMTIMALSLGIILQIFSGGLRNSVYSEQRYKASLISQSLFNEIGNGLTLAEGQQRGQSLEFYSWLIDIKPYQRQQELFDIMITVTWRSNFRQHEISSHSLRIYNGDST